MNINKTKIKDLLLIENLIIKDSRGSFQESYNKKKFEKLIKKKIDFVQDNISISKKNVLRGIHYQINNPQAKLVNVLKGSILDIAVDLRKKSKTFGKWQAFFLNEQDNKFLWIPEGFGHAFLSLKKDSQLFYKVNNFYDPKDQNVIIWNDSLLNIKWPLKKKPIISKQDLCGLKLKNAKIFK
jgi:dTDP-4-dehydrorhamnose 3,5-epimerase